MNAFAISGFFAAVAGALFADFRRSVRPENSSDRFVTVAALLAGIIGGVGTLAGPPSDHLFQEFLRGLLTTKVNGLARYLRANRPGAAPTVEGGGFSVVDFIDVFIDGRAELYLGSSSCSP